jgi:hypothetical protein
MIKAKFGFALLMGALFSVLVMHRSYAQQPVITAPPSGTIVTPGQSLTISVGPASLAGQIWVWGSTPLPDVAPGSSPNTFTVVIPLTIAPGPYILTATVVSNGAVIYSSPVTIDVETLANVEFIAISPSIIVFSQVGDQIPLQVFGTTPDGTTVDVTHSTYTTYSSANTQIATVDGSGIVTAVSPGGTQITACYQGCDQGLPSTIRVTVPLMQGETPTYNITAVPTVSVFQDSQGNYAIFINIVNNSNVTISQLNITQAVLNSKSAAALPLPITNLGAGTNRTVNFSFPPSAGASGSRGLLRVAGTYVGSVSAGGAQQPGAVSLSFRVSLP